MFYGYALGSLISLSGVYASSSSLKGGKYLFDLTNDPTETTNLYHIIQFSQQLKVLESTVSTWSSVIRSDDFPDSKSKKETWKSNGGVSPWLNDTSSRVIEQIYHYHAAPHIVYFLIDDWGYNDVGYRSTYLSWTTPTIDRLAAEGVKLENYYTSDLCTPSRGALLTGRYPFRLGN